MGYYINPPSETKEQWLQKHGTPVHGDVVLSHDFSGPTLPVCLVDNGPFTAAGIAFDAGELRAFGHPDRRPKSWFLVSREDLEPYYRGK